MTAKRVKDPCTARDLPEQPRFPCRLLSSLGRNSGIGEFSQLAPPAPVVSYVATDTQPATPSFDAVGFVTHEVLSADSVEFSDVSLNLVGP